MSFSQRYHPTPQGPAPVRIECLVMPAQTGGVYTYEYKVVYKLASSPNGPVEWGAKGEVTASDSDNAEAQVYGKLIDDLAQILADELCRT